MPAESPTVSEIQAQQQALRIAEAQNALPHIEAVRSALGEPGVVALAELAQERAPLVADPQVQKALNAIGNLLTLSGSILGRLKDEMAARLPDEAAAGDAQPTA